jgi:hypothetical protein
MLLSMTVGAVLAEDGLLFRKNISKTPDNETEKAAIYMMDFYVPAQSSAGVIGPVTNYQLADETYATDYPDRNYAKPLVSVWIDDLHPEDTKGGITFGHFDAFAGVSLDDGTTWKTTNLSKSSDLSSISLDPEFGGEAYPGDVHNVVHQVAGDNIFVAWVSKYCEGGSPLYALDLLDTDTISYLTDLEGTYGKDAIYLYDLFGVGGKQDLVDYTIDEDGDGVVDTTFQVPYSCVWTARGKLLVGDDPSTTDAEAAEATYVMWQKPERLTSGARDANLPAVDCAKDAGCILTWQEDPEGLRPGQGLGPGEGWSGAIANSKTDIWYSYIDYDEFDLVFAEEDAVGAITMADYADGELTSLTTMPKPYVPMAIPVRLTDNNMCKADSMKEASDPYCYIDFDSVDDIDHTNVQPLFELTEPESDADYCEEPVTFETPNGSVDVCKTADGRVLNGRVASTRVRLNLKPYTISTDDNDTPLDTSDDIVEKSAWVVMAYEETKALGDQLIDPYTGVTAEEPIDIGKDVWYHSFDMFDHDFVDQGGILNQPAVDRFTDEFFPTQTDPLNLGEFYLTEIARRFALTTNSVDAAVNSESGLSAMLIYKQGIINQGGPADIFLRRVIIPDVFDPAVDNPYAYENMECAEWAFKDTGEVDEGGISTFTSNPNYLQGICLSPAINISGTTIVECDGGSDNDACAGLFPVADDGSIPDSDNSFPKVREWRQLPYEATVEGGDTFTGDLNDESDLDDQSWENPFDVSKGHRGFLDGDFVMMMYAWSPNWKSNSVGNDHYNLYVRRSFDGGLNWTTTPASTTDADYGGVGRTTTENYCVGVDSESCVGTEFTYAADALEQGQNVSQLIGNKVTILDPRYTPTGGLKLYPFISEWFIDEFGLNTYDDELPYLDDAERDPSKFFMIYETGDNTTVAEGEAVPLNLYYSRATVYGDVWEIDPDYYDEEIDTITEWRWPWVENKQDILSGEAGMLANPGGTFMYSVWNQWEEEILDDGTELVFNSDIIFRRFLYIPDWSTVETAPIANILSSSQEIFSTELDEVIYLYGSGRDLDLLGDQEVEFDWYVNGQKLPDEFFSMGVDCDKGKLCNAPAKVIAGYWDGSQFQLPGWSGNDGEIQEGWYEFSLQVKDNEGRYSKLVSKKKYITMNAADAMPYGIFLPLTVR